MEVRPPPWIADLQPYVPGRPAMHAAGSLASNECAIGPSPTVLRAIASAAKSINRYPDPLATELREALSERLSVDSHQILIGNGSDELLYLLALAFAASGGTVLCADPPYRLHELAGRVAGASVKRIALKKWTHDLEAMATVEADLTFICNPHNPTATVIAAEEVEQFLLKSSSRLVVVDEAYIDFADDPDGISVLPLAAQGRLAVLRTFSKVYGLAGARIGWLVAGREVINVLQRIRPPFSVNTLAQAAALAVLKDREHQDHTRHTVLTLRQKLVALFESAGYQVVPSQANFILVVADDEDGLVQRLQAGGISVRPGKELGIPGAIRVTVPNPEGLSLLEDALLLSEWGGPPPPRGQRWG